MKRVIIIFLVVLFVGAWYFASPAFIVSEADDESPLRQTPTDDAISDRFLTMSEVEKQEMETKVAKMAEEEQATMLDTMPFQAELVSEAPFMPRAHEVYGKALLIRQGEKNIIRFEDFETVNGPELHIYLAKTLGNEDFIDLGNIKATKGNVNYAVPDSVDVSEYNKVLVWCKPFGVLFSYADLG